MHVRALPLLTVVSLLMAGCGAPDPAGIAPGPETTAQGTTTAQQCPTHWHATFAIFLPGAGSDPQRVDFASPRTARGAIYYDAQSGATAMDSALHMHQVGGETGSAELGPAQWHMEARQCTSLRRALEIVEVEISPTGDSLTLRGGHAQVPGQSGTFAAGPDKPLRYWLKGADSGWEETSWEALSGYQIRHMERLLVALGPYSEVQVATMQAAVPMPAPA